MMKTTFFSSSELRDLIARYSQVFILTDEEVARFWLPEFCHWMDCNGTREIVLRSGEEMKTLKTAQMIWEKLLKYQADRHALLVNLGGGVISDLGGFVASCYKRGVDFVNVPTTLLAMVDAAIGGKNGVDFQGYKNQIGTFAMPLGVWICPTFLKTLPPREVHSGWAEMMKYGFIKDEELLNTNNDNYTHYIQQCAEIKSDIVAEDPYEKGPRKVLNFGHTLGHALEAHFADSNVPLTHGEAVAYGMWAALWLSCRQCGLSEEVLADYEPKMEWLLSKSSSLIEEADADAIIHYLSQDKKNESGEPRFVLLEEVGKPIIGQAVPMSLLKEVVRELALRSARLATLRDQQ